MWSPLTVTLVQSTIINAISNVLAQIIDQWKHDAPFELNTLALIQFVTYAIIIVPINFSWQKYIEVRYPGFPTTFRRWFSSSSSSSSSLNSSINPTISSSSPFSSSSRIDNKSVVIPMDDLNATVKDKPAAEASQKWRAASLSSSSSKISQGTRNFLMKFFLDQSVASVMNILLFIILINLLKGMNWVMIWDAIGKDFGPIMIARLKYRPVVSMLMYTVVPVDRRVVFGSACGVVWGIYLSLYAAV